MTKDIDTFFASGCGRCALFDTPECKVHTWHAQLLRLREILQKSGLKEEMKWGVPCYTHKGKNVILLSALKDGATLGFLKGSLLKDVNGLLISPGENSQASRYLKFTDLAIIESEEDTIQQYIQEAILLEEQGKKVPFKKSPEPIPEELEQRMKEQPALAKAFNALTPGRQRGYILHISGAKQSSTRLKRVDKHIPRILEGKGMHDR